MLSDINNKSIPYCDIVAILGVERFQVVLQENTTVSFPITYGVWFGRCAQLSDRYTLFTVDAINDITFLTNGGISPYLSRSTNTIVVSNSTSSAVSFNFVVLKLFA